MNIRKLSFEFFGTAILLIAVVGSSFMASYLKADWAIGLLINAAVTAAALAIIIKVGAPISGAHYNPVVSMTLWLLKKSTFMQFLSYAFAQVLGALVGVVIANAMFSADIIGSSAMERSGIGLFIGEIVATVGLVYLALSSNEKSVWKLIPLWIFAAYFFTSSTSFANPAVTFSRVFTDAPAGIELGSVGAFVLAQVIGALIAFSLWKVEKRND
jgi:glycerol uptake facilitator-like aquaporin